nr:T9SS type A sorting domain-containing protein [Bacteroidota bacterium]
VAPSDEFIGTGQGFFVLANSSGTIYFKNSMRSANNDQFFKSKSDNIQRAWINLSNEEGDLNQIAISFHDEATKGYDRLYDAYKLQNNNNLTFYSLIKEEKFVIQSLPSLNDFTPVQLGYNTSKTGVFSFSLINTENLDQIPITLEDKLTGEQVDLTINPEYSFYTEQTGDINDRFVLYFKSAVGINDTETIKQPIISVQNNRIVVSNVIEFDVRILDITGRVVLYNNMDVSGLLTGIYLVEITTQTNKFVKKVYIK